MAEENIVEVMAAAESPDGISQARWITDPGAAPGTSTVSVIKGLADGEEHLALWIVFLTEMRARMRGRHQGHRFLALIHSRVVLREGVQPRRSR